MKSMRLLAAVLCFAAAPLVAQEPTIAQTRPNVKVLKDLTEYELFLEMNFLADSLGVHCDYCHVKAGTKWMWADDSKPTKAKGLQMISMTRSINESNFRGTTRVTCYTCHRGSLDPARIVPNPPLEIAERTGQHPVEPLPSAQQVLERYFTAIGGKTANARPLHISGAIDRSEGRHDTFELSMHGEEKIHLQVTNADGVVEQTIDGPTVSVRVKDKVTELTGPRAERAKRSFAMYAPVKVREAADQLKVDGTEVIDGHKAYVLHADDGNVRRKLYFDATSGLLVRELRIQETPFVPLLDQIDFSDYRDVGGVKVPFVIRTSDGAPYDTATRRLKDVKFED